jgi:hypothetical protein
MWDAVLCIGIIGGFFVLRAILATAFFFYLLPEGVNCPNCDAVTLRVESRKLNFLMPKFRTSWCIECGWQGLLRERPTAALRQADAAWSRSHSGQLPESSKKSSK